MAAVTLCGCGLERPREERHARRHEKENKHHLSWVSTVSHDRLAVRSHD